MNRGRKGSGQTAVLSLFSVPTDGFRKKEGIGMRKGGAILPIGGGILPVGEIILPLAAGILPPSALILPIARNTPNFLRNTANPERGNLQEPSAEETRFCVLLVLEKGGRKIDDNGPKSRADPSPQAIKKTAPK